MRVVIGLDIGSASARSTAYNPANGRLLATSTSPFALLSLGHDRHEHSREQILEAVCRTINEVCEGIEQSFEICGIGVDAACSFVFLGPLPHATAPYAGCISWMDHRAISEANEINSRSNSSLRFVGGIISPEMQVPKLAWLFRHEPDLAQKCTEFCTSSITRLVWIKLKYVATQMICQIL